MRRSCHNPNEPRYAAIGGRGIRIFPAWGDFAVFLQDMGPRPTPRHRLIRIDETHDFDPDNCRWETESERRLRRRSNSAANG